MEINSHMLTLLWIIAAILVISGIVTIIRGSLLYGILL
ncbi:MAG: GPGG-motif small membrane protein, partial [Micromonosporaceae bacterium]